MTPRGRPKQTDKGSSVSSRVKLTPVRRERIDAELFAKALLAAQLLDATDRTEARNGTAGKDKEERE